MTLASTGARTKPALDESSFQQLLAAAYVVQQHNDGSRAKDPAQATSGVLSEVAEIQSLVRAGGLDLVAAARLTTDRLQKITHADGVAIALMTGGSLECLAQIGSAACANGNGLTAYPIVPTERLKAGEFFQSSDVQKDIRFDPSRCREAGVGSLIAAPIHRFDEFDGLIEVRWTQTNAFQDTDTRATRLMAGLIGGLLERNARAEQRRSSQLIASDIQPDFTTPDRLGDPEHITRDTKSATESGLRIRLSETVDPVSATPEPAQVEAGNLPAECRVCGRPFGADEAFCGQCSMPRVAGAPSEDLQSKWASLWYMQRAQETQYKESPHPSPPSLVKPEILPSAPESFQPIAIPEKPEPKVSAKPAVRIWHVPENDIRRDVATIPAEPPRRFGAQLPGERSLFGEPAFSEQRFADTSNTLTPVAVHGSEAYATHDLLQSTWQTVWARMRRRHSTLALSAVGLLLLFLMLAVWPSSTNSQLTWFQSVLVELGLAEVPTHAPILSGNPDVRVWVDVHTALYYCPGSDLYGKTPGGHFATQHDAQMDEFEPASRVACP